MTTEKGAPAPSRYATEEWWVRCTIEDIALGDVYIHRFPFSPRNEGYYLLRIPWQPGYPCSLETAETVEGRDFISCIRVKDPVSCTPSYPEGREVMWSSPSSKYWKFRPPLNIVFVEEVEEERVR